MLKHDDQELSALLPNNRSPPLPQPLRGWRSSGLLLFPTRLGEGVLFGKKIAGVSG